MGWLNLIDLAIDVKQSADLYKARDQLERIETGALQESLRKQIVEVLRNFVFAAANEVKTLEPHLESSPQPVYVAARVLDYRFQDVGISPEVFPEFSDKEYVQRVQKDLTTVIQNARSKLAPDQISRGEECVNAFVQMPLIDQAIEAQTARNQLQATEEEWKQKSAKKRRTWMGIVSLCAAPVCCICSQFSLPGMGMALGSTEGAGSIVGLAVMAATFVIPLALLVGGIVLLVKSNVPGYGELKKSREQWQKIIPDQSTWKQIVNLFGQQSIEGYQHIRAERQALIQSIMGQIDGPVLQNQSLPPTVGNGF